jgi:hypothetical protein
MDTGSAGQTPQLKAVVDALLARKASWRLKAKLLKGVVPELKAARDIGLTWQEIWQALKNEGYPGSYPQFCKSANRWLDPDSAASRRPRKSSTVNQPTSAVNSTASEQQNPNRIGNGERWQARKTIAQQLLTEAEQIKQQQAQDNATKIPVFTMTPFKGRQE